MSRLNSTCMLRPKVSGGILALAVCGVTAACYSTRPVTTPLPEGTTVVLDLTDQARVELGDRIGPAARRIEGELAKQTDSSYSIRVASIEYVNGQSNRWSGEPFTVPTRLVSQAWQREFSQSRTTALGVGIAGALVGLIKGVNLGGSGSGSSRTNPTPPAGGT